MAPQPEKPASKRFAPGRLSQWGVPLLIGLIGLGLIATLALILLASLGLF